MSSIDTSGIVAKNTVTADVTDINPNFTATKTAIDALCADVENLTFVDLTDTPANYTGAALQAVRVNAAGTALEFFTAAGTGTVTSVNIGSAGGLSFTGGPITTSGTFTPVIDAAALRTTLNVADGATANSSDAFLLARANHTGTQLASTISDFSTAADARIAAASVTDLSDVTDAGSGQIITAAERALVNGAVQISANAAYFVNASTGSDSNDGLTSGTAFATIQKAVDTVSAFNLGGTEAVINVAAGSYARFSCKSLTGGTCRILGAGATTIIDGSGSGSCITNAGTVGLYTFDSLKVDNAVRGFDCSLSQSTIRDCTLGAVTADQIRGRDQAFILIANTMTVDGDAAQHVNLKTGAELSSAGVTLTLSGTRAFSIWMLARSGALVEAPAMTFVGTATGVRYIVQTNAIVDTSGGGATYFPGNTAGSTATGGQYA